jgi:hypothetical protein
MTAIPPEGRGAHHALIRRLMTEAVEEIREFVGRERLCCPFRLTGAEGVKDFIRAELHLPAVEL